MGDFIRAAGWWGTHCSNSLEIQTYTNVINVIIFLVVVRSKCEGL